MRLFLSLFSAAAITLNPIAALAGEQFVTVEAVHFQDGNQTVTSLSAGNDARANDDGIISFDGQVLSPDGKTIPITVNIQTEGLETPPSVEQYAEITGRVNIVGSTTFSPTIPNAEIQKTLYTLSIPESNSFGTISITDDPLPIVAAWLAIAALSSITGLAIICDEKFSLSISGDLEGRRGEVQLECIQS